MHFRIFPVLLEYHSLGRSFSSHLRAFVFTAWASIVPVVDKDSRKSQKVVCVLQRSFSYIFYQEFASRWFLHKFQNQQYFIQTTLFNILSNHFQHCEDGMKFSQTK